MHEEQLAALAPVESVSTPPAGCTAIAYLRDRDSEGVVRQVLNDLGVTDARFEAGGLGAALTDLNGRSSPRLLIVDVSGESDPTELFAKLVSRCEPSTGIVVVGDTNDIRLYRGLMGAGAAEYFFKPLVTALVSRALGALLQDGQSQSASESSAARMGKLIFVLGARGGCGATSVAVRIAWRLAEHPPRPVVLADLDFQCGDAALQLDAIPGHALREALQRADRVDELFLERGIVNVTGRLDLLAALEPLEDQISLDEEALLSLLKMLRRRYRYVVVDVPIQRVPDLPRVLHLPSLILIVSDGGLASARDVARLRALLGPYSAERTCMHVLNKAQAPGSLSIEEFTRGAGQAPDVLVPWAREIAMSAKLGLKPKPESHVFDTALAPVFARVAGERVQTRGSSFLGIGKRGVG